MGQASASFWEWVKRVLSDNGEPSSSRTLMVVFSFFTMGVLMTVLHHMYYMQDPNKLAMWLNALPYLIFALSTLIVLPYTINSGRGGLGDIANIIGQMKNGAGAIGNITGKVGNGAANGAGKATGSAGPKG